MSSILIIENDSLSRNDLKEIIETLDPEIEVEEAANGIEALVKVESANYDLILINIHMSKIDGKNIYQTIRSVSQSKGTPFIFITSVNDSVIREHIDIVREANIITKPISQKLITAKIQQALNMQNQL